MAAKSVTADPSKRGWRRLAAGSKVAQEAPAFERDQLGAVAGADVDVASLLRAGPAGEEAGRAESSRRDKGAKGRRARIAQETLQILEAGGYRCDGQGDDWVDLRDAVRLSVVASLHYPAKTWQLSSAPSARLEVEGRRCVEVRRCYVLDAAESLARGCGDDGARLGVLNFASARNPGGGFTTGAEAQEESIARSSALYPCLMKHFREFFVPNRNAPSGAYTHDLIYSPGVPVFRDSSGALLCNPYLVDFATAAAPNRGTMRDKDPARGAEEALRERARRVLDSFAHRGVADLVLGAWGCGVFKNDPRTVARIFDDHLRRDFHGCFRRVVFAVPDGPNASAFEEFFSAAPLSGASTEGVGFERQGDVPGQLRSRIPGMATPSVTHAAAPSPAEAAPRPASALSQHEKDFLKSCKVVRDIMKLEAQEANGETLAKNQAGKLQKKVGALQEVHNLLQFISAESDLRQKNQDVLSVV